MTPFYLRFPDEATGRKALVDSGLARVQYVVFGSDGKERLRTDDADRADAEKLYCGAASWIDELLVPADTGLDVIGEAWRNDVDPPVKRSGWFANWIGEELPAGLQAYRVDPDPSTPFRVFAGWSPEEIAARAQPAEGSP